jgi:hypothetical protein
MEESAQKGAPASAQRSAGKREGRRRARRRNKKKWLEKPPVPSKGVEQLLLLEPYKATRFPPEE